MMVINLIVSLLFHWNNRSKFIFHLLASYISYISTHRLPDASAFIYERSALFTWIFFFASIRDRYMHRSEVADSRWSIVFQRSLKCVNGKLYARQQDAFMPYKILNDPIYFASAIYCLQNRREFSAWSRETSRFITAACFAFQLACHIRHMKQIEGETNLNYSSINV